MAELKAKVTLKEKGEAAYVSLKQLMVTLRWTASVDLDLMAFYRAKDGRKGGVFSNQYPGGSLGSMNMFPYIELSGDAGVGAAGGDNEEVLRIAQMDELSEIYICTINYSEAIKQNQATFSNYDGGVIIMDDRGETIAVPLNSTEPGNVAVIAKIDNTNPMGPKLSNENRILSLDQFLNQIPGAEAIVNG